MATNLFSSGTLGGIGTPLNFNTFWVAVKAGETISAGDGVHLDTTAGTWVKNTTSWVANTIYGICNDDVTNATAGTIINVTNWGLANVIVDAELTTYGMALTISHTNAGQFMTVTDEIGQGLARAYGKGGVNGECTVFFNGFGDTDTDTTDTDTGGT